MLSVDICGCTKMEITKILIFVIIILGEILYEAFKAGFLRDFFSAAIMSINADKNDGEAAEVSEAADSEQETNELSEEVRAAICDIRNVFPDDEEEEVEETTETESPETSSEEIEEEQSDELSDAAAPPADREFLKLKEQKSFWSGFDAEDDVSFYLFSRKIWTHQEIEPTQKSFSKSKFNKNHPTRFVVHGWQSKYTDMLLLKDSYLKQGDVNCIMVDWSLGAGK